jgi:exodeoxyribonuclease VII large subunit
MSEPLSDAPPIAQAARPDAPVSNAPEWSVSELSQALKRTVEDAFGYVKVRGEISGFRGQHSSGHAYFTLKDEGAKIDAVIWKSAFARLKLRPQEGLEVIAHGRLTTFPGKSSYQIVIERLEPAGLGALMALLEERRRRLAAEGLFDEARKRPIPFLPAIVGVVTSPTGAVIRDILHRLSDRFPRRVVVWPVRVQGETAAQEIAAAIRGFDALGPGGAVPRPDVLIIARGGGSLEDLWSFNEEVVVRAASACTIPLVSAVGHETDWTLIDHVADRRAPTPTGAAEMVVPVRADLVAAVATLRGRITGASVRHLERRRSDLRNLSRALPAPDQLLAGPRQRLDLAAGRLTQGLILNVRRHQQRYEALCRRLVARNPTALVHRARDRLGHLGERLDGAASGTVRRRRDSYLPCASRLAPDLLRRRALAARDRLAALAGRFAIAATTGATRCRDRLERLGSLLEAYSYERILERGFALVRDEQARPVRNAVAGRAAEALDIQFADGHVRVRADAGVAPQGSAPQGSAPHGLAPQGGASARPQRPRPAAPSQGNLFEV